MRTPLRASDKLVVSSGTSLTNFKYTDNTTVRNRFNVEEIPFEAKPIREQKALFYAKAVPFKILSITAPTDAS
jgi:hypothetical protein